MNNLTYLEYEKILLLIDSAIVSYQFIVDNPQRQDDIIVGLQFAMNKTSDETAASAQRVIDEAAQMLKTLKEIREKIRYQG